MILIENEEITLELQFRVEYVTQLTSEIDFNCFCQLSD